MTVLGIARAEPDIDTDRNAVILRIRRALKARSGKSWSVTGHRGTAWGWITIDAPPARRTVHCVKRASAMTDRPEDYEEVDTGQPGGCMTHADQAELAALLGLDNVHHQGVSIPSAPDDYREYVDRAEGRVPAVRGTPYWD